MLISNKLHSFRNFILQKYNSSHSVTSMLALIVQNVRLLYELLRRKCFFVIDATQSRRCDTADTTCLGNRAL